MKKILLTALPLTMLWLCPLPAMAGMDVDIHILLPPAIVYAEPPELIVLPETYIYAVPDIEADIYFHDGWWWRPWDGHWYRSRSYSSGWSHYQNVPVFARQIPSGWRNEYRERRWKGHKWHIQRLPQRQVQQNWNGWEKNRHWEKQQTWGVRELHMRPQSQQRFQEVQSRQPQPNNRKISPQHPKKYYKQDNDDKHDKNQKSRENKGNQGNHGNNN